jgi:phosphate/phosphite/phosphonate ABC transporter binding protein
MSRLFRLFSLSVAVYMATSGATLCMAQQSQKYTFAVLPRFFPVVMLEQFGPLADYIGQQSGIDVEFYIPKDFAEHIAQARQGKLLLTYQNPVVFAKISNEVTPLAIASKGSQKTRFRGIIIVRTDSGINKLEDLRGKSVSVVSMTSAGGYISQRDYLMKKGIKVEYDMIPSEAEQNKQENVIFNVYSKKSDVGFIQEAALHRMDKVIDPSKIKVLVETSWLPNWIFAAHKSVSPEVAQRIQSALIKLAPDHQVLKLADLDGFEKPNETEIADLRRMVLGQ